MHRAPPRLSAYAGWVLVLLAAAVAATLALGPAAAQEDPDDGPAFAFAATSYANNCAQCHGQDGSGGTVPGSGGREAPGVRGEDGVTAAYVDLVLRTGRMPPAGDPFDNRPRAVFYDDEQREAMVAWMSATYDLEDDLPDVVEGEVARGLELFALNCAHCHGNTGAGGTAGQAAWTPQVNNLDAVAIVEAIRVGPFEMPAFGDSVLTDEEAGAIASYLRAVGEEAGTPVLGLVELNPVFASGLVGVLAVLLLGALLYVGSRPAPFEAAAGSARELAAPVPSGQIGMTPAPDAPDRDTPTPTAELRDDDAPPTDAADEEEVPATTADGPVGPVEAVVEGGNRPSAQAAPPAEDGDRSAEDPADEEQR